MKLQWRGVFHHAYWTYILASNQAIKGQKPITKALKPPKEKKRNYTKIKKCSQKYAHKRVYDFPNPTPRSLNVLIGSPQVTT